MLGLSVEVHVTVEHVPSLSVDSEDTSALESTNEKVCHVTAKRQRLRSSHPCHPTNSLSLRLMLRDDHNPSHQTCLTPPPE